jgi:hypothetical protein
MPVSHISSFAFGFLKEDQLRPKMSWDKTITVICLPIQLKRSFTIPGE